jgi:hypothetical protein
MPKQPVTWIPIFGDCKVSGGVLKYVPATIADGENKGQPNAALVKSDQMFESGTVILRARIGDPEGKVQIGFSHGHSVEVFAGLNIGSAAYGIATLSNNQWENFRTAAYGTAPPAKRDVQIKVTVTGSQITMWIDGVEVVRGTYPVRRAQLVVLLRGSKPIEAELVSVQPSKSIAFVVMQFTPEFNSLYTDVIMPGCIAHGFVPVRADDIYNNGLIVEDIARSIRESALVIADITPDNPNVYYEVGYAHGIAKPTILLADRKREALPFDVSGFRTIFYENSIGGKASVEERLNKHIASLLER